MEKNAKEEVLKIMDKINNPEVKDQVNQAIMNDPYVELRVTILDFFKYRLDRIRKQEEFKGKIQESLSKDVDNGGITANQKITLYKVVCEENTVAVESLFNLFRSKTGDNILLEKKSKTESLDSIEDAFKGLSVEESEKVDKLFRIVKAIFKKSPNK